MTETTTRPLEEKRERLRKLLATQEAPADPYTTRVNPGVSRMLTGLGLDVQYVQGSGTTLIDQFGRQYLDFAGAYGALPFGHNPPAVWEAIAAVRDSGEPSLVQPSLLPAAGELAARLCELAPDGLDRAWFCNSGAEAVEAALKLVRAALPDRRIIVSTDNGFHGKTLGALSVTGRTRYQQPFGAPAPGHVRVPYGVLGAAERFMVEHPGDVAAFVIEPIQGEGGINPAPPGYLPGLRRLCDEHGALLVVDEVQTGLGRTGSMFAVEQEGIRPDVLTLAKALGGGLVPIGAVLFGRHVASAAFDLRHTSTFGGNSFCARVGLATLDLLTRDDRALLEHVRRRGEQLGTGLATLVRSHSRVAVAARGRGLLWGLEFTSDPHAFEQQGLIRSLADAEGLVGLACGHLLRRHGVRVAPTFFSSRVLRIEPPLTVSADEIDTALAALDATLGIIERGDSAAVFAHLVDPPTAVVTPRAAPETRPAATPAADTVRWAFIAHPTDELSYASFDRRLGLPGKDVRRLFDRLNGCRNVETPTGMLLGDCEVLTDDGRSTYGEVFALGYDARELMDMPGREAADLVRGAVVEAVGRGAQIVGLGAYTSIVTGNGSLIGDVGALVTTGNAFTVSSAVEAVTRLGGRDHDVSAAACAVVGAAGNIGRACALLLCERAGRMVLTGNPVNPERTGARLTAVVEEMAAHLAALSPDSDAGWLAGEVARLTAQGLTPATVARRLLDDGAVVLESSLQRALQTAPLAVVATSTPEAVVRPEMLPSGSVLCDVSQPPNIGPDLWLARPDVTVVPGGLVRLPGGRSLGVDFGLPPGVTYACTAETLVAAARFDDPVLSRGDRLDLDAVRVVAAQARQLGFRLHVPNAEAP